MTGPKNTYVESASARLPVPDPTELTTQALLREIGALKELFDTRFSAIHETIRLIQVSVDHRGEAVRQEVGHLDTLFNEKFIRIQTQINERDIQTDKASRDVKSAVDAAFAAAKEAVGEQNKSNALSITKSEAATTKQIDGIFELARTNTKASDDKFSDIKDRLTTIESHSKGVGDGLGWMIGTGGVVVGIVSIVVSVLLHFK